MNNKWINPLYDNIEVGDKIMAIGYRWRNNLRATVVKSTSTQVVVEVTHPSGKEDTMTFSKTTGDRIRCNEFDKNSYHIGIHHEPYQLLTWEDQDERDKAAEAQKRKEKKGERLDRVKWVRNGFSEEELDQVIALLESFGRKV